MTTHRRRALNPTSSDETFNLLSTERRPMAEFEHERFLRVVSMDADSAKAFAMPDAFKVICAGQADPNRYKFGARVYLLFQTAEDYSAYKSEGSEP